MSCEVVTSGSEFIDIDAYGGMIAYAELLQLQGKDAIAASSSPMNESITPEIRSWGMPIDTDYTPAPDDTFALIDVSIPDFIDPMVEPVRVVKVLDHHAGYEKVWEHLGDGSVIQFIGAACTLVYLEWVKAGRMTEMSQLSARVLIAGILDNTLNMKSQMTNWRDEEAYTILSRYADLPESWPAKYFTDCQATITVDLPSALRNDAKTILNTEQLPCVLGQLVVWDGREIAERRDEIADTLSTMHVDWALNLISIEEGRNYLLADNPDTQAKFGNLMDVDLSSGVATTDRLYLRKEILKKAGV